MKAYLNSDVKKAVREMRELVRRPYGSGLSRESEAVIFEALSRMTSTEHMTNYDRIRKMTRRTMAMMVSDPSCVFSCEVCPGYRKATRNSPGRCRYEEDCLPFVMQWLDEEAEQKWL